MTAILAKREQRNVYFPWKYFILDGEEVNQQREISFYGFLAENESLSGTNNVVTLETLYSMTEKKCIVLL